MALSQLQSRYTAPLIMDALFAVITENQATFSNIRRKKDKFNKIHPVNTHT
jgi:hypothetical protein